MAAMLSAALLMTGCAAFQNMSSTGKGATIGGGGGAVAGAGIGALAGGGKGDENNVPAIKVTFDDKILFATGKSELGDASRSALKKFASSLAQSPETDVAIYGHTDNTGSREINQKLSEERAQAVSNYLIGQKIDPNRITTRGLAYDAPIADNSTEEGRAQNRRVEILITANDNMIQQAQQEAAK